MQPRPALLSSLRNVVSRLHPPAPPTSREGQQLLKILHSSFLRKLDAAHPTLSVDKEPRPDHEIPIDSTKTSAILADHYASVLSHPLLKDSVAQPTGSMTETLYKLFEAKTIKPEDLRSILVRYNASATREKQDLAGRDLSPHLDKLIKSASFDSRTAIFTDRNCLTSLLNVVVAEKCETILWQWLRSIYDRSFVPTDLQSIPWLNTEDLLVSSLMRMAIQRSNIEEAAQQYVQACEYRSSTGRTPAAEHTDGQVLGYKHLTSSLKRLATTVLHLRTRHRIPTSMYDGILKYNVSWSRDPICSTALLTLYHPQHPSAKPLLSKLQDPELSQRLQERSQGRQMRQAVLLAILDGARLMVETNDRRAASKLMDYATKHYADLLPVQVKENTQVEIEEQLDLAYQLVPA